MEILYIVFAATVLVAFTKAISNSIRIGKIEKALQDVETSKAVRQLLDDVNFQTEIEEEDKINNSTTWRVKN